MSYADERIAKNRAASSEYQEAFDEEARLLQQQRTRRKELMKKLVSLRKSKRLSQKSVAEALKISQARVSQMERGEETLSIDRFLSMVEFVGVTLQIVPESGAVVKRSHPARRAAPSSRKAAESAGE